MADYEIIQLREQVADLRGQLAALAAEVKRQGRTLPAIQLEDGTLRRDQAAKFLGLAPRTLNRMATRREGPPFIVFRGSAYYRRADLEQWRAGQTRRGCVERPAPARAENRGQTSLFGDLSAA